MPNHEYFRRQSELCLRLAMGSTDGQMISRFVAMAEEYRLKAEQNESESFGRDVEAGDVERSG
jgi:hypothetical protein